MAWREFEYTRHGTLSFMINFDVATGQVFSPSSGTTRTDADFVAHRQRTIASDPTATQWHFVVDNLEIHHSRSESLVRDVARMACCSNDLGVKYVRGVLRSKASRAAFMSDPTHPIVVHYTPKHASWRNQVLASIAYLRPHHGQAVQMDLPGQATPRLTISTPASSTPGCTGGRARQT
jgi:DDE superfamily endonuclease